ncbi:MULTISPECIES: hypothetical protein [Staphylococcus]|uniref:Uncharacterized protein n=1 Tax=Staphylococcus nepalensis TaxID=214473 RepID=A0ABS3L1C6_9STAP|nr:MULTISPECIES: hypothetical protein [Staphylococcus]MBO1205275.1 hypothetical protein [Staphylococcus nepalensis]MBO1213179.1 hypothetical protein [Staphylococcus nepalensis]MBO1215599.1 hypothetical protein [Staphylococcus nepalensis]MBO1221664.1 hypothetical protein [Staphylococcus nepalensis]MBO1227343.1 hypothetical protein [Staphylococcus nepalensis]
MPELQRFLAQSSIVNNEDEPRILIYPRLSFSIKWYNAYFTQRLASFTFKI